MKKFCAILMMCLLLCGCNAQQTFETVNDVYGQSTAAPRQVSVQLPKDAAVTTMEQDASARIYLCDGYTVTLQTLEGGDLNSTIQQVSGFTKDALTVLETGQADLACYEFVWTAAGEAGPQIGRAAVLDDCSYHYAVTVMADADKAGPLAEVWQEILHSVTLAG